MFRVPNLVLKMGFTCSAHEHLDDLTTLSAEIDSVANLPPNPRLPFVGSAAFAHKGGIHVQAVALDPARTSTSTRPSSAMRGTSSSAS